MNILLESKAFKVHCDVCGKMLTRTPSGRCCPAGHGKIHKPFPERWASRLNRFGWANSLPVATRKGSKGWEVTGVDGLHQIVNATEDDGRGGALEALCENRLSGTTGMCSRKTGHRR